MDDVLALRSWQVRRVARAWDEQAAQLGGAAGGLSRAHTSGLPADLAPEALAFLDAWVGVAKATEALAAGCAETLDAWTRDADGLDAGAGEVFAGLDVALASALRTAA